MKSRKPDAGKRSNATASKSPNQTNRAAPRGRALRDQLREKSYEEGRRLLSPQARNTGHRSPEGAQHKASRGVQGSGGPLPFLDKISASFGRHDVTGVQSYSGGDAAEACEGLSAAAYATGNSVAFRGSPSLHTAAHEAAHTVQQRGGVSLKGGVGQAGDTYEQHADAVADMVVQGQSAEGLLDQMAGSGASTSAAVQAKETEDDEEWWMFAVEETETETEDDTEDEPASDAGQSTDTESASDADSDYDEDDYPEPEADTVESSDTDYDTYTEADTDTEAETEAYSELDYGYTSEDGGEMSVAAQDSDYAYSELTPGDPEMCTDEPKAYSDLDYGYTSEDGGEMSVAAQDSDYAYSELTPGEPEMCEVMPEKSVEEKGSEFADQFMEATKSAGVTLHKASSKFASKVAHLLASPPSKLTLGHYADVADATGYSAMEIEETLGNHYSFMKPLLAPKPVYIPGMGDKHTLSQAIDLGQDEQILGADDWADDVESLLWSNHSYGTLLHLLSGKDFPFIEMYPAHWQNEIVGYHSQTKFLYVLHGEHKVMTVKEADEISAGMKNMAESSAMMASFFLGGAVALPSAGAQTYIFASKFVTQVAEAVFHASDCPTLEKIAAGLSIAASLTQPGPLIKSAWSSGSAKTSLQLLNSVRGAVMEAGAGVAGILDASAEVQGQWMILNNILSVISS